MHYKSDINLLVIDQSETNVNPITGTYINNSKIYCFSSSTAHTIRF